MIGIGLHGCNGHQLQHVLEVHPLARLAAVSCFPEDKLAKVLHNHPTIPVYQNLDDLLNDPGVDLVSLCSPLRSEQASDAIKCLKAGKHVLAEKPCALAETDLDAIIKCSLDTGKSFHEMAGTAFAQPYEAMRHIVQSGDLGEIIQVTSEKSYPYYEGRPDREEIDGGQIGQNAIHALRFVEHVACCPIASIRAVETKLGNPSEGRSLVMASSLLLTLKNGGIASLSSNYLNPKGTGIWGYESLKIFGSQGMVESHEGGNRTRLVLGEKDLGPLDLSSTPTSWLNRVLLSILNKENMPISLEEELSPTRWALRAKQSAFNK